MTENLVVELVCEAISYKVNAGQLDCRERKRQSTGWMVAKEVEIDRPSRRECVVVRDNPEWEV